MALLEHEAQRFAEAMDDYEHVSIADMGGTDEDGYWLVVRDHRFDLQYAISSHAGYWEFIARHAVGRPAGAATSAEVPPAVGPSAATLAANRRAAGPAEPAPASTARATA